MKRYNLKMLHYTKDQQRHCLHRLFGLHYLCPNCLSLYFAASRGNWCALQNRLVISCHRIFSVLVRFLASSFAMVMT